MLNPDIFTYTVTWCVVSDGPTRSGVEEFEGMDIDDDADKDGPGPQRCKIIIHQMWHMQAVTVCI